MAPENLQNLMLSRALRLLSQVDDMRRLDFALGQSSEWEPPMDVLETASEVLAYVALPGVDAATVEVRIERGTLIVRGTRPRPPEWPAADILRLELPWGPFRRCVPIPTGCELVESALAHGSLVIRLAKRAKGRS